MSKGIWLSDNSFMDVSAHALTDEIAVRQVFSSMGNWLSILPDPDPILQKSGEGVETLETLASDYKVLSCLQTRKLKTLGRGEYSFKPGAVKGEEPSTEAEALCEAFTKDLERIDLYNLISEILDAPAYGMTVSELIWEHGASRMVLTDIIPKPRRWFAFDNKNELRLIGDYGLHAATSNTDGAGVIPRYGKFALARHFPTYENPYGLRLLSRCLFPVAFKKGGIEFMMRFAEKWGMPWVVGKAGPQATTKDMQQMTHALAGMVQDAVAVVRGGSEVQVVETGTQAGDLHLSIVKYWDDAIAQVLVGQTLTSTVGEVGSYAASKTHGQVLSDYTDADGVLVKNFFDDLAYTYTQLNAPHLLSPTFSFDDPEDLFKKAELGEKLHNQNVQFTAAYYERHFGLAPDEFTIEVKQPALSPFFKSTPVADISAKPFTPGQQSLDKLMEELLPVGVKETEKIIGTIMGMIDQARSPDELRELLAKALAPATDGGLTFEGLTDAIEVGLFAADMMGRFAARENVE